MIKLIASDLDGTLLLHGAQSVSKRALKQIQQLSDKGILFVAASGRQYPNLFRLFEPVSSKIAFICENGALVMYQNKIIQKHVMEHNMAMELIRNILSKDGCEVLVSGPNTSFIKPKDPAYQYRMEHIVKNNVVVVDDFSNLPESILKISVFEKAGIRDNSGPYFINAWNTKAKCTISEANWLDFVNPDVNKGNALNALVSEHQISLADTVAFGDNYNDLEILSIAGQGYIMEHAAKEIQCQFTNRCQLVEDTLDQLLLSLW